MFESILIHLFLHAVKLNCCENFIQLICILGTDRGWKKHSLHFSYQNLPKIDNKSWMDSWCFYFLNVNKHFPLTICPIMIARSTTCWVAFGPAGVLMLQMGGSADDTSIKFEWRRALGEGHIICHLIYGDLEYHLFSACLVTAEQ